MVEGRNVNFLSTVVWSDMPDETKRTCSIMTSCTAEDKTVDGLGKCSTPTTPISFSTPIPSNTHTHTTFPPDTLHLSPPCPPSNSLF